MLTASVGGAKLEQLTTNGFMSDQFAAFLAAVEADEALQEQLKAAADADAVVAIAKAAGFLVSDEDWVKAHQEEGITEEELEGAAGGRRPVCSIKMDINGAFGGYY